MSRKIIEDEAYTDVLKYASLNAIKLALEELIDVYGESAELVIDSGYSSIDVKVRFTREENDKEYQKRLKNEAREKDLRITKEDKERKEYERLKKKFS